MAAWLEKGKDVYQIVEPVSKLGRDETNEIVIPVDLVSRVHAMIYEKDGIYCIRDLQSRNGTFVNEMRIEKDTLLHDGDIVKVGFDLTFRTGDAVPGGRPQMERPKDVYRNVTGELSAQNHPDE